ncbi:MAG: hypothetical protein ACI9A7_000506 [Cyclobacteriaceae bacterium]|jgi:hypothetical protein
MKDERQVEERLSAVVIQETSISPGFFVQKCLKFRFLLALSGFVF